MIRIRNAVAILLAVGLVGCDGDEPSERLTPLNEVYVAVLEHLDIATLDDDPTVVHIVDPHAERLGLDAQVAVIQALDGSFDVRFIDGLDAVADVGDDGTLVASVDGPVVEIGAPTRDPDDQRLLTVRTEMFVAGDGTDAWLLTLRTNGVVRVVDVTETEPELLVEPVEP